MKKTLTIYVLLLILIPILAQSTATPPFGQDCIDPLPYPGDVINDVCVTAYDFSVFNDTGLSPIPTCDFGNDAYGWFSWTAPVTTVAGDPLYLNFDAGYCGIGIEFYLTDCLTPAGNCLGNNNGLIIGITQGTNYLMQIWDDGPGDYSCDFCLTIAPPPPAGDECIDPIPYPGDIANDICATGFDFTNYSFTGSSPAPNCTFAQQTVWFNLTTPVTTAVGEPINLVFDGTSCSLSMEFYALDCLTQLSTCIFSSGLITGLLQGTDYLMVVNNNYGGNICDICLSVAPPPPPNDECTGAIPYPGDVVNGTCVTGFDFSQFSDSGISPSPYCDGGDATGWFTFTAPVTTAAGEPLTLQWDAGTNCSIGIDVFETDCFTNVSNCLNNSDGFLPNLIQGNNYLLVLWDDGIGNFSCDFCLTIAPPPPPGDECIDPIPYPGDIANDICVTGFDFTGFTNTGQSPFLSCGFNPSGQVWFTVTTPITTVAGESINLLFDAGYCTLGLEFYSLDCSSPVSNCFVANSGGIITGLTQGTDYLILVHDVFSGIVCDFCLTVAPPPPPNDECSGAIPYPGDVENEVCVTNVNFLTAADSGDFLPTCDGSGDPDVWYSWTAPITTAAGDPIYLNFDDGSGQINNCFLGIEFYDVDCSTTTPVSNCLSNNSGLVIGLTQGTDYLMLVYDDGPGGISCDFCLTVAPPPPPGDECTDPIPYPGDIANDVCVTGFDFTGFTNIGISPNLSCGSTSSPYVWFTVTTPITTVAGEPINLLFDAGYCNLGMEFYPLDCSSPVSNCFVADSGGIISGLTQGTDYLILVHDVFDGIICDFCLTIGPPPPPNDECSGAIPYPGDIVNGTCVTDFDFSPFTDTGLSPSPSCDGGDATAWFTFSAPVTTFAGDLLTMQWDEGNNCGIGIDIFDTSCNASVSACLNNFSGALPNLIQGNDYLMVVWDDGDGSSNCDFCLSIPTSASNNDLCSALPLYLNDDCSYSFPLPYNNFFADNENGEPVGSCFPDGINNSVWFSFVAPGSGVVDINTDFPGSGLQDTQLALYELPNGDCSNLFDLVEVACNEDALPYPVFTNFNAAIPPVAVNPGQTYYIQLDSYVDNYTYDPPEGDFCIVVNEINPPSNDNCANPEPYGGFGPSCTKIFSGTTIGASAQGDNDLFSCDNIEFNASVYYTFVTGANVTEVEFNLQSGSNINVTLFTDDCQNAGIEIGGNCFTNLFGSGNPNGLFTNLMPQTTYVMAIWTNSGEESDFSFCLTRPTYSCGDSYCYEFAETYSNCPQDCPCFADLDFYNSESGFLTSTPYGVCPEILDGTTDPNNPGLYIPFFLQTNDTNLTGSSVTTTIGTLFENNPLIPLTNGEANSGFMNLFLTEAEILAGGIVTIFFDSDNGACFDQISFDISILAYTSPSTAACGNCSLEIVPDYDNAICSGTSVTITVNINNFVGPNVWISLDGNTSPDYGTDFFIDTYYGSSINFGTNDATFTFYDQGQPNCAFPFTITSGNYTCDGAPECATNEQIATVCRLEPEPDLNNAACNDNGTINVPIDMGSANGAVNFLPIEVINGDGTAGPFSLDIDINNCQPISFTVSDQSTCDETPIVTVNSPESVAGGINVETNSNNWGVQIPTELGACGTPAAVTANIAVVNDGDTSGGQLTDFCEPTPPALPNASICNAITGKIAMVDRGQCAFVSKAQNAEACGAVGLIVCNCLPGPAWCVATADVLAAMGGDDSAFPVNIPTVFMLYEDCQKLKMELNNGNDVELCIGAPQNLAGCERDFTLDVCNDFSEQACDDGDCSTENDIGTFGPDGNEVCACLGTPIECEGSQVFNPNSCQCEGDCGEEINGAILAYDPSCDVGAIDITIIAPDGTSITVTTNADGSFTVPGGPFPCGEYTAAIVDPGSLPICFTTTGSTEPIVFEVDGTGNGDDGPFFFSNPEIPTLSQWGLISLALLLMIFGALKLVSNQVVFKINELDL